MRDDQQGGITAVVLLVALCIISYGVFVEVEGSDDVNVMVPAYFDPTTNPSAWAALNQAASSLPNRVVAVANANSGPGTSAQAAYSSVINALQAKTGRVIGYVRTNYGRLSLTSVETEIDSWYTFYPSINGIFLDEAANTIGNEAYYQNLYNYIKAKNSSNLVVTNQGTATPESFLFYNKTRVADVICVLETNVNATTWTTNTWTSKYDRSNFYGIFYNVPDINVADFDYGDVIDHGYQQNLGWVYVTNDNGDNPYDTIPSYFTGEVQYIKNYNYL